MDLRGAVELGHSPVFLKGSFKASHFGVWEVLFVLGHKLFESLGGCQELAVCFPGFQLVVCGCVKEMVFVAILFADVPL